MRRTWRSWVILLFWERKQYSKAEERIFRIPNFNWYSLGFVISMSHEEAFLLLFCCSQKVIVEGKLLLLNVERNRRRFGIRIVVIIQNRKCNVIDEEVSSSEQLMTDVDDSGSDSWIASFVPLSFTLMKIRIVAAPNGNNNPRWIVPLSI